MYNSKMNHDTRNALASIGFSLIGSVLMLGIHGSFPFMFFLASLPFLSAAFAFFDSIKSRPRPLIAYGGIAIASIGLVLFIALIATGLMSPQ